MLRILFYFLTTSLLLPVSKAVEVIPELAHQGSFTVGVTTVVAEKDNALSATDFTSRYTRPLKLEIWYPASKTNDLALATYSDTLRSGLAFSLSGAAYRNAPLLNDTERFPLLVFSHGYTGYRSLFFPIAEHLASHGYIVASIDHTDSTNAEVDFAKNPGSGFASTLLNRAADQQFTMEYMFEQSSFQQKLQLKAGLLGYSMGGFGALATVGACYSMSDSFLGGMGFPKEYLSAIQNALNTCAAGREQADNRWQAMAAFAPWGGAQQVFAPESFKNIKIPTLLVAGEHDDVSGYADGVQRLFSHTKHPESYLLVFENARHNIIGHAIPEEAWQQDIDIGHYFEPSWSQQGLERLNKHFLLSFYDCKLKRKSSACDLLPKRENAVQLISESGEKQAPWPGFKDRWGLGMRFYRKDLDSLKDK